MGKLRDLLASCFDKDKCEGTAYPFWIIIDPKRVPLSNYRSRIHHIAGSVVGPFFSREAADDLLKWKSHHFSKHAVVYCSSGHASEEWKKLIEMAKGELK